MALHQEGLPSNVPILHSPSPIYKKSGNYYHHSLLLSNGCVHDEQPKPLMALAAERRAAEVTTQAAKARMWFARA